MRRILMFVMVMVMAMGVLGDDAKPSTGWSAAMLKLAAENPSGNDYDNWLYWQAHFDKLELLAKQPSTEIDECWECFPYEVLREHCKYVAAFSSYESADCDGPNEYEFYNQELGGWVTYSKVVETRPAETGYKRGIISASYYPSTISTGHSSGFNQWWTYYVEATNGGGGVGVWPSSSYGISKNGSTSASNSYWMSYYSWAGQTFTTKNWNCETSGQECQKSVFIHGAD